MFTLSQLRALVMYVEHDVDAADSSSADRQPTAFSMLKALLNRKFQSKEIPAVMEKVFQLSIKSTLEGVRNSCRQLALQYLLNYPIGKKIKGKSKKTAVKLTGLLLNGILFVKSMTDSRKKQPTKSKPQLIHYHSVTALPAVPR